MSKDEEERGKKRFFESLYDLDVDDEIEAKDEGRMDSIAFLKSTKPAPKRPRTAPSLTRITTEDGRASMQPDSSTDKQGLRRSVSAPIETTKHQSMAAASALHKAAPPKPAAKPSAPSRTSSTIGRTSTATKSKRKRTEDVRLAPVAQRIFADLTFYFFPNSDTNVPRRQRIQKTIEYGAVWSREWSTEITHVIVDKSFDYTQLLTYLKLSSLPDAVIVVNETYPAECLVYRCMLDPAQKSYQVPGRPEATAGSGIGVPSAVGGGEQPALGTQSSTSSLPLKPPTRAVLAREPRTPSRTDEESLRYQYRESERPTSRNITPLPADATYNDALGDSVAKAKAMQDVPIDVDEEGEDATWHPSQEDDTEAESSDTGAPPGKYQKKSRQDNFQCMHKHDGTEVDENPNAHTIEILQKMATYYDGTKDQWRTRAYRRAIGTLRKQTRWITTAEEARLLPEIGSRLADKIEEIASTRELRRLDAVTSDPRDAVLQQFTKIYGVGIAQASKWVEQGFRTLDDLRTGAKLTPNQEVGLAHYDDFLARIPRGEVKRLADIVDTALRQIDPGFEITIGGSYRRGSQDSGDIDLIITKPNAPASELRAVVLEQLVPKLFAAGFLKCALAVSSRDNGSKWHGACALPDGDTPWRRIDLLLVPWAEMGAALIYFTGNDVFNRSIRLLASTKGMRLNQRGLYKDVLRGRGRVKITEGELLEGRDERRIFEILGVAWRPPEHRVC